jgi:hypothetical protein
LSAGVAALASACGGGGGGPPTGVPPDALAVVVQGSGYAGFRVDLRCAVADRDACAAVLDAATAEDGPSCAPAPAVADRIVVTGTIEGEDVSAVLRRRTSCEIERYDDVLSALGL